MTANLISVLVNIHTLCDLQFQSELYDVVKHPVLT